MTVQTPITAAAIQARLYFLKPMTERLVSYQFEPPGVPDHPSAPQLIIEVAQLGRTHRRRPRGPQRPAGLLAAQRHDHPPADLRDLGTESGTFGRLTLRHDAGRQEKPEGEKEEGGWAGWPECSDHVSTTGQCCQLVSVRHPCNCRYRSTFWRSGHSRVTSIMAMACESNRQENGRFIVNFVDTFR